MGRERVGAKVWQTERKLLLRQIGFIRVRDKEEI